MGFTSNVSPWRDHKGIWNAVWLSLALSMGSSYAMAGDWSIVTVNGDEVVSDAFIRFMDDGGISGSTGCNRFQTRGEMRDGAVAILGPIATTKMACVGDTLIGQETAILKFLGSGEISASYDPFADTLRLEAANGKLELIAAVAMDNNMSDVPTASNPEGEIHNTVFDAQYLDVFGLSGKLNLRAEPSIRSEITGRLVSGTLLINDGCEEGLDHTWCKVRAIGANAVQGWAAADYLEPATALVRARGGVFDRLGRVSCVLESDAVDQECQAGIALDEAQSVVLVYGGSDREHAIVFEAGSFVAVDPDSQQLSADVTSSRNGDVTEIRIGEELYTIPDILLRRH